MARTDKDVATKLNEIYFLGFGGKIEQRFVIDWSDVQILYQTPVEIESTFPTLRKEAENLYLLLSTYTFGYKTYVAVVLLSTVKRWRRVPRKVMREIQFN